MLYLRKLKRSYPWLLLLIVADSLIVANSAPWLGYGAALFLLAFVPGWLWLAAAGIRLKHPAEQAVLAVGLSLALTIVGAMLAVYLPGPLAELHLLLVMNGISLAAGVALLTRPGGAGGQTGTLSPLERIGGTVKSRQNMLRFFSSLRAEVRGGRFTGWIILLGLVLLAALLRLPNLDYAEFHEDEAEALMLGVRLMQGEDYALFLHRKGPAQMLVPVSFWLLSGRITEAWARFPFALCSMLSAAVIFFMGRRWFNPAAGALAGLLWAVNGYALAFGRMVQYQALIFFLGPLALFCLYLAWQEHRPRLLPAGAVLLAACLLAHFDALLLLPAAGYLGWQSARAGRAPRWAMLSLLLLVLLLAAFYIPYLLDPEFSNTAAYLAGSRIRPGLLYNNLDLLQGLDADYSSRFYLPLVTLGLVLFVVRQSLGLGARRRWLSAGLGLLVLSTAWFPELWRSPLGHLAVLPWLLLGLLYAWSTPKVSRRAAWLMFGAAFTGYAFLVDDPRTHLYILYPGAALLAGAGWSVIWRMGRRIHLPAGERSSREGISPALRFLPGSGPVLFTAMIALFCLAVVGVAVYESLVFLQSESALAALRAEWEDSAWERVYDDLPGARSYFGYPKREGWKAIGALRAEGAFPGDFRSVNEDFVIPIWYNYGQPRSCYNTPAYYFVRIAGEEAPDAGDILAGYREVAQVRREGEVRLRVLAAQAAEPAAGIYSLETLANRFDRLASPQQFVKQAEPGRPVGAVFGEAFNFVGYDLPASTVKPGQTLTINLYWQALEAPRERYRAFVHLTGGSGLLSQQDDDPVCRLPTLIWRAGQRGMGQFRLAIDEQTPPGRYPLIIGLYHAETLERLKITGGAGQPGDDFLWLGDIEVGEK